MKVKRSLKAILLSVAGIGVFLLIQRLLEPKYMSDIVEGGMIEEYYAEEKKHNVIFIGDCEVYENISPVILWEKYGINSYIRGSAQQLIWQSYYLLEETLTYETPEVVVFNVLSMKYNTPQKEEYNRMTIDGMKWSESKINSILASMTKNENFIDYVFPILRYHSRWNELTIDDFKYMFYKDTITHNGYYMRVDIKSAENIPEGRPLADYQFGDNAYYYLDKMVKLCKANDVELVLMKAPSLYPYWYDEWEEQIEEYAQKNQLRYYNFLEVVDEIGLDFNTDTYDAGLHLNLSGAEKLADYFGGILINDVGVKSMKDDGELSEIWKEKIIKYNEDIENQKNRIKEQESQ